MHSISQHEAYLEAARARYAQTGAGFMHSLSNAREFILRVIETADVRSVCEIGSEGGLLSQELHRRYVAGQIDKLTIIDPMPSDAVAAMSDGRGCDVRKALSLEVLGDLPAHDLYIVDGDHNYFTVTRELEAIFANRSALVVMHDIAWPCSSRDMYYNPETIPPHERHPLSFDLALDPAHDDLVESGLESHGYYAVARKTGGPRNGVFTALKDVAEKFDLEFDSIPALLGIGIVRHKDHTSSAALRKLLPTADIQALLWRLEENRLSNWVAKSQVERELHLAREYQKGLEVQLAGGIGGWVLFKLMVKYALTAFRLRSPSVNG
jgi:hypothetical protein|nr:class I SAM-dependent methyltransferase [Neorhizobium tomejilense]